MAIIATVATICPAVQTPRTASVGPRIVVEHTVSTIQNGSAPASSTIGRTRVAARTPGAPPTAACEKASEAPVPGEPSPSTTVYRGAGATITSYCPVELESAVFKGQTCALVNVDSSARSKSTTAAC